MQSEIKIRQGMPADAPALAIVCRQTFYDTYRDFNTESDMQNYMAENFSEKKLRTELNSDDFFCFVAEKEGELTGYIALKDRPYPSLFNNKKCIEISRYYVLKKYQGFSIGKLLMNQCIDFAAKNNYEVIWLGVWQKNQKAIDIYLHQGFRQVGSTKFKLGDDIQDDFILAKEIK